MKPSHYADKMLIMELEKSRKTEQKPPNHPVKPGQRSRAGSAGVVLRAPTEAPLRAAGVWSGWVSATGQHGGEDEHDSVDLLRSNELQTKLNFFFLWRGSNLSQFGAGASKPGVFNERMCSVMESAAFKPRCDALSGCSIWPPGLSTHKTSADTSGENEMAQIKAALAQPSSRGTARL